MYSFQDFIGPETLSREYKEFSLHKTGISYDIDQVEHLCDTNEFDFQDIVIANIEKYIQQYIPKYMCGFSNSGLDGEIFIGTDDYGYVKGIPLKYPISKEWLTTLIKSTLSQSIQNENKPFDIPFTVDIHYVQKPEKKIGCHPQYSYYLQKKQEFIHEYKEFLKSYHDWQHTYEIVNMKLVDIVNQSSYRKILINFIMKSDHMNQHVLDQLHSDFQLPSLSGEEIKDLKIDETSVFYWVTIMKDKLCEEYRRNKPYFHNKFKYKNIPFNLLISISEMIPYWVDQIDLVLIHIKCKPLKE